MNASQLLRRWRSARVVPGRARTTLLLAGPFLASALHANVLVSGANGLAPSYPDLQSAITALNTTFLGGNVNMTVMADQVAPPGGYVITATGTASEPISINGNGFTVTASAGQPVGSINDGIFKIVGGDYITLQGFVLRENPANTVSAVATNTMTEYGIALLNASPTDGPQHCTIFSNTISLDHSSRNTFAIYGNSCTSATDPLTAVLPTSAGGAQSYNWFQRNTISNVNQGIVLISALEPAVESIGLQIGGVPGVGNTLTDVVSGNVASFYIGVHPARPAAIHVVNGLEVNIQRNTVTTNASSIASSTGGIRLRSDTHGGEFFELTPHTVTVDHNTLQVTSAGDVSTGIDMARFAADSCVLSMSHNRILALNAVEAVNGIQTDAFQFERRINDNTFEGLTIHATEQVLLLDLVTSLPDLGYTEVIGNRTVGQTTITQAAAGSLFYFNGLGEEGSVLRVENNSVTDVVIGSPNSEMTMLRCGATPKDFRILNNVVSGVEAQGGTLIGMTTAGDSLTVIELNEVSGLSGTGNVIGMALTGGNEHSQIFRNNHIHHLAGQDTIVGLSVRSPASPGPTLTSMVERMRIHDLESSGEGPVVGMRTIDEEALGGAIRHLVLRNNLIGALHAPQATNGNAVRAIDLTTPEITTDALNNTFVLDGTSSGSGFGSSVVNVLTTTPVRLVNNILVNRSTPTGGGHSAVLRLDAPGLTNYDALSNTNLLFAGTPSADHLIFTDGTNNDQTLAAFQTRLAPRDAGSITEDPSFLSLDGNDPEFLHIALVPSQIDGGGTPLAEVPMDYDEETRSETTPDIGADEYALPVCTTGLTIEFTVGANGNVPGWELRDASNGAVAQFGAGFPLPPGSVIPVNTCLPDGEYYLRVVGAMGAGGGYVLRTSGSPGTRIIDNTANYAIGGQSLVSTFDGVQIPVGPNSLIYTSCDKYWWKSGEYIVCNEDADVTAQFGVTMATSGYEFWIYDPNGGYSFRKLRNHQDADMFAPFTALRACHMKINNWAAANHVPQNMLMNVRVRARVAGVNKAWGPACRFIRNDALAACPPTKLMDIPGNPYISCGATRAFVNNTANRIHARPVSGATQYQFRFSLPGEGGTIVSRFNTTYYINLGWTAAQAPILQNGVTYDVDVRAMMNGVWCAWGEVCKLTICNAPPCGGSAEGGNESMFIEGGSVLLWPNPSRGDQVFVRLDGSHFGASTTLSAGSSVTSISIDLYDMTGKRMLSRTIAVNEGAVTARADLGGDIAPGLYLAHITVGDTVYTERFVIEP